MATQNVLLSPPLRDLNPNVEDLDIVLKPVDFSDCQQISVNGTVNNSALRFQTNLPGGDQLLDRCMYVTYQVRAVLRSEAGQNISAADFENSDICFSQFPLHRVTNALTVSINNVSKTVQPNIFLNAIAKYFSEYEKLIDFSMCPSSSDLTNCHTLSGRPIQWVSETSFPSKSQFKKNNSFDLENGRVCKLISVAGTTTQAITIIAEISEPVFNPLCQPDFHQQSTFANVTNLRVEYNFQSSLTGMLSMGYTANDGNGGTGSVDRYDLGTLAIPADLRYPDVDLVTTFTPILHLRTYRSSISVPQTVKSYFQDIIVNTSNTSGAATFGLPGDFSSGNISYPVVPSKLYIFLRPNYDTNHLRADAYGTITNLRIQTPGQSALFSNFRQQDLYAMSRKNSLDSTYAQFCGLQGSVVCINVGDDLGGYVPGSQPNEAFFINVSGKFTNTVAASYKNGLQETDPSIARQVGSWQLVVLAQIPTTLMISPNQAIEQSGLSDVSASVVDESAIMPVNVSSKDLNSGGGFWKDFKRGFDRGYFGALKYLNPAAELVGKMQGGSMMMKGGGYKLQA